MDPRHVIPVSLATQVTSLPVYVTWYEYWLLIGYSPYTLPLLLLCLFFEKESLFRLLPALVRTSLLTDLIEITP